MDKTVPVPRVVKVMKCDGSKRVEEMSDDVDVWVIEGVGSTPEKRQLSDLHEGDYFRKSATDSVAWQKIAS